MQFSLGNEKKKFGWTNQALARLPELHLKNKVYKKFGFRLILPRF